MKLHYSLKNYFSSLDFSQKVRMTYLDWCSFLLNAYSDKKLYKSIKEDLLYFKGYFNLLDFFSFLLSILLIISNIVLFPIYALIFKIYWNNRYNRIVKNSDKPVSDIIVSSIEHPHLSGLYVESIISSYESNGVHYYKVVLSDKNVVTFNESQLLFKNYLLNERDQYLKKIENIEYKLSLFKED